jgi:N-acetylmuramoyl-L-alanine amidase
MRKINEIVVHCTATPEGRMVSVATIRGWHKARGWSDIGYHYVVHLDGRVEAGRPVAQPGSHVAGRNAATIGVCYVGGTDRAGKPMDTRTAPQKAALRKLLLDLVKQFPSIGRISGHNEYANKACPCFDARTEYADIAAPKPVPTSISENYTVKRRGLSLYSDPGSMPVRELVKGEQLVVTGRKGDWIEVLDREGSDGFVREADLDTSETSAPLGKSRTVRGNVVALLSTGGALAADASKQIEPLVGYSEWIKWAFIALTLAGIAYALFARVDDARPGREDG